MIQLTKLNDRKVLICLETVKYMEAIPDTLITFINGDSLVVKESLTDIQAALLNQKSALLQRAKLQS